MSLENWWVIIAPLLFGLGWVAARLDRHQLLREQGNLPRSYFRGLNFLLNEQPDEAIDAFIEVARLDPETVELHFALGNLFRRRGETGRAIRVHQNLVNRPDLNTHERHHALYELGQDFLKAGMLDRAQAALADLSSGEFAVRARGCLLQLYELEKDWPQAIAMAQFLQRDGAGEFSTRVAQFYCELAQDALTAGYFAKTLEYLDAALLSVPRCARALMLLGDMQIKEGNQQAALATWHSIPSPYIPLVADRMLDVYAQSGRSEEGLAWLQQQINSFTADAELLDIVFKHTLAIHGPIEAEQFAKQMLLKQPTIVALTRLVQARLAILKQKGSEGEPEQAIAYQLLQRHSSEAARYQCKNCGFRVRLFYWQCPGCAGWETFSPKRILSGA